MRATSLSPRARHGLLGALGVALALLALLLPLDVLEYLSLHVVGEPPINGRPWSEGVVELGGALSMRLLAVWGIAIVILAAEALLAHPPTQLRTHPVPRGELAAFLVLTAAFCGINALIGYAWWDPDAPLGMGSLFWPSMASLVVLGLAPRVARRVWREEPAESKRPPGLARSPDTAKTRAPAGTPPFFSSRAIPLLIAAAAFGYGLVSCLWHCCSFFSPTMYFFFFVTKFVQLWGVGSFFYQWGFPALLRACPRRPWLAYAATALLFGFAYPWHTVGFALTFTLFGLLLGLLVRRTGTHWAGILLLYAAYLFHAGLPWHGPAVTYYLVHPLALAVLAGTLAYTRYRKKTA